MGFFFLFWFATLTASIMEEQIKEEFKMKQFWKDYGELCKETGRFYKKHWKGAIVLNGAIMRKIIGLEK